VSIDFLGRRERQKSKRSAAGARSAQGAFVTDETGLEPKLMSLG
jgi:hypothetical protein